MDNPFSVSEPVKTKPVNREVQPRFRFERTRNIHTIIFMIRISWVYAVMLVFLIAGYFIYGILLTEELHPVLAFAVGGGVFIFGAIVALVVYFKVFPAKECYKNAEVFKATRGDDSKST